MLRFEGDRGFPLPPSDLWAKLTDAQFLVQCLPDVETIKEAAADRAVFIIRPSLAFVRGALDVTLRITEAVAPSSARVTLTSKGIGSSSTVEAALALEPTDAGTQVHWTAEVKELTGLLKMVPPGLIRGAAEKVVNDVWTAIAAKLTAT